MLRLYKVVLARLKSRSGRGEILKKAGSGVVFFCRENQRYVNGNCAPLSKIVPRGA